MKKLGYKYDTASHGLEALEMYEANPDLYPFVLMGRFHACDYSPLRYL